MQSSLELQSASHHCFKPLRDMPSHAVHQFVQTLCKQIWPNPDIEIIPDLLQIIDRCMYIPSFAEMKWTHVIKQVYIAFEYKEPWNWQLGFGAEICQFDPWGINEVVFPPMPSADLFLLKHPQTSKRAVSWSQEFVERESNGKGLPLFVVIFVLVFKDCFLSIMPFNLRTKITHVVTVFAKMIQHIQSFNCVAYAANNKLYAKDGFRHLSRVKFAERRRPTRSICMKKLKASNCSWLRAFL